MQGQQLVPEAVVHPLMRLARLSLPVSEGIRAVGGGRGGKKVGER